METLQRLRWLVGAAERPQDCEQAWRDDPRAPHVFPAGRDFDVVSVDLRLGLEAADLLSRRRMPLGPVALDYSAERAGFLLPARSQGVFERLLTMDTRYMPEYRYLAEGSYVVLPGPLALPQDRYQWLSLPPRHLARDSYPEAALALMLASATELLTRADCFGQIVPVQPSPLHESDSDAFLNAVDVALNRTAVNRAS